MPTLPWSPARSSDADPEAVVVLGTQLRLGSYRHTFGFLRVAMRVRKQLIGSPGALGVSLLAKPLRKTYWTLSAWTDQESMDAFVHTQPHLDVMRRYHDRLDGAWFTSWSPTASELPKPNSNAKALWAEARDRLAGANSGGGRP
jgi:hypothetical protein